MKKLIVVGLSILFIAGVFASCNTYQRCPAYTDNAPVQEECDML